LLEVQMFRCQWQVAAGVDYELNFLTAQQEKDLQRMLKELSPMISTLQNDLGLTKAQRDKDQHESIGSYINDLKVRAKAFGVMREKQLGKALELMKDTFSVAGAYKRSNEHERKKLGFESAEDVIDFILETVKPQFDEVDEYFRENDQKFWIRRL
jgi:Skp family chaperone for outer membrane proteins